MAIVGETVASGGIAGQRTLPLPLGWGELNGQEEAHGNSRFRGLGVLEHGLV